MRIAYIFPSRSRPDKFFATLDNIIDNSFTDDYFIWSKLDTDDASMNNDEVKEKLKEYPQVTVQWGTSRNKIHACNRSLGNLPECSILVLVSDDMQWTSFAFDDDIREAFLKYFPDLDGVIHFPEEKSGNRTMVLTIMGVNLFKKLGYLYWPAYESVYADNDLTEMTRSMGKYVFVNKKLFAHKHPIWGGGVEWDAQYIHSERPEVYKRDGEIFRKRKANNFDL